MKSKRILILNTIIDPASSRQFDRFIRTIYPHYQTATISSPEDSGKISMNSFSHLILSGSELRASQPGILDEFVFGMIDGFRSRGCGILGICYGHQMLARALSGSDCCRQASRPEFGWTPVKISSNPLFRGITEPVFFESHFDEVFDLPAPFEVIAVNKNCPVQAFQYASEPFWGIQFHPEVDFARGKKKLVKLLEKYKEFESYFSRLTPDAKKVEQNFRIFRNFIET